MTSTSSLLGGLRDGAVWVVTGPARSGRTALAIQLAAGLARSGSPVRFFLGRDPIQEMAGRLTAHTERRRLARDTPYRADEGTSLGPDGPGTSYRSLNCSERTTGRCFPRAVRVPGDRRPGPLARGPGRLPRDRPVARAGPGLRRHPHASGTLPSPAGAGRLASLGTRCGRHPRPSTPVRTPRGSRSSPIGPALAARSRSTTTSSAHASRLRCAWSEPDRLEADHRRAGGRHGGPRLGQP